MRFLAGSGFAEYGSETLRICLLLVGRSEICVASFCVRIRVDGFSYFSYSYTKCEFQSFRGTKKRENELKYVGSFSEIEKKNYSSEMLRFVVLLNFC